MPMRKARPERIKTVSDLLVAINPGRIDGVQSACPNPGIGACRASFREQLKAIPIQTATLSDKIDALILLKTEGALRQLTGKEKLVAQSAILKTVDCSDVPLTSPTARLLSRHGLTGLAQYAENVRQAFRTREVREEVKDCVVLTGTMIPGGLIAAALVGATPAMFAAALAMAVGYAGSRFVHDASDEGKLRRLLAGGGNLNRMLADEPS